MDASRDFLFVFCLFLFLRTSSAGGGGQGGRGGGGALPDLYIYFPCSADHERDWPAPYKVIYFGLATNALNVRNNNNNNNTTVVVLMYTRTTVGSAHPLTRKR